MIVEKEQDIEGLGALKGERVQMGFATEAIGQLMDNMAKHLYARPKEAIVREYSTNGWDAQVAIGETRPLEVTLPTPLNPVLTIRDFGIGLDYEGIETVYSQYGASTKRDSNDYNGTFGIGGKSAFAYSNRFTVVSVKDGRRTEVIVTRDEGGTAEMIVVTGKEGVPTDEPRGTTVKIPSRRGDDLVAEAAKVYYWFQPGSVLVNGEAPVHFDPQAEGTLEIAPGMYVVKNHVPQGHRRGAEMDDQIVMGNVAYPTRLATGLDRNTHHLVCFVPLGSVAIPSSREKLIDESAVTQRKLEELLQTFKTALAGTLQKRIDAAATPSEAANVLANWRSIIPSTARPADGFTYKGNEIPLAHKIVQGEPNIRYLHLDRGTGTHNKHEKLRQISLAKFHHTLWIEGFTSEAVSATQAQKARKYIHDTGINSSHGFVFIHEVPAVLRPWLEHVVDYDTVKAVKLPRDPNAKHHVQTNSGRIPGSYDLYTTELSVRPNPTGNHVQKDGVPAETFRHWSPPLYYAVGNKYEVKSLTAGLNVLTGAGYTLVALRADRVAKFTRNFPAAQNAQEAIKAGWAAWSQGAGRGVALGIALQQSRRHQGLRELDPGKISDPELRRWVGLSKKDLTAATSASKVFTRVLGREVTHSELPDLDALYPLLDVSYGVNTYHLAHIYVYLNAIYAARQAGQTL